MIIDALKIVSAIIFFMIAGGYFFWFVDFLSNFDKESYLDCIFCAVFTVIFILLGLIMLII